MICASVNRLRFSVRRLSRGNRPELQTGGKAGGQVTATSFSSVLSNVGMEIAKSIAGSIEAFAVSLFCLHTSSTGLIRLCGFKLGCAGKRLVGSGHGCYGVAQNADSPTRKLGLTQSASGFLCQQGARKGCIMRHSTHWPSITP